MASHATPARLLVLFVVNVIGLGPHARTDRQLGHGCGEIRRGDIPPLSPSFFLFFLALHVGRILYTSAHMHVISVDKQENSAHCKDARE